MKISIARYPQLQLGHKALKKRYDQKNKASKNIPRALYIIHYIYS